jgi:hypothetical protein
MMQTMPAEPLILSYAHPSSDADAPPDATVFTFASPPVRMQYAFIAACLAACVLGAIVVIGLGLAAIFSNRMDKVAMAIISIIGLSIILGIALVVYRELARIRRVGQAEVRIEVKSPLLFVWAPQQWGFEPRTLELEEIKSISAHSAGVVVGGVPIFQIHIRRTRWLTTYWAIRVAVADAGVIKRSIADLNATIERARRNGEKLPSDPIGE